MLLTVLSFEHSIFSVCAKRLLPAINIHAPNSREVCEETPIVVIRHIIHHINFLAISCLVTLTILACLLSSSILQRSSVVPYELGVCRPLSHRRLQLQHL